MSRWGLRARRDGILVVTDPERIGVPDQPVRLPENSRACLACGVAVPATSDGLVVVEASGRAGGPPRAPRPDGRPIDVVRTELLRCPDCRDRLEAVHALLDAHPRVRLRLGDHTAEHQTECALLALAVLGHDLPDPEHVPEAVLLALLRHLAVPGAAARWAARFAPVLAADARVGTCSPRPWAHVKLGQRLRLRQAYAAVLRERFDANAPPVRLGPPEPDPQRRAGPRRVPALRRRRGDPARRPGRGPRWTADRPAGGLAPLLGLAQQPRRARPRPAHRPRLPPLRGRPGLGGPDRPHRDEASPDRAPPRDRS